MADQDTMMVTDPSADPSGQHGLGCPGCTSTGCAIFGCLQVWEKLVGPLLADQPAEERWCRRCGCTDLRACVVDGEACHWVDEEAGTAGVSAEALAKAEGRTGTEQGPLCSACRDAARLAIDAAWRDYAGMALAAEAPALQRPSCRRAFYVGVLAASRGFRGGQEAWRGEGPDREQKTREDLASLPVDELERLAVAAVLDLPMVLAPAFAPMPAEAGSADGDVST